MHCLKPVALLDRGLRNPVFALPHGKPCGLMNFVMQAPCLNTKRRHKKRYAGRMTEDRSRHAHVPCAITKPQQKTAPKQGDKFPWKFSWELPWELPWFAKVLMNCLIRSGAQGTHFSGRAPMKL
jgi:hypothetical protein